MPRPLAVLVAVSTVLIAGAALTAVLLRSRADPAPEKSVSVTEPATPPAAATTSLGPATAAASPAAADSSDPVTATAPASPALTPKPPAEPVTAADQPSPAMQAALTTALTKGERPELLSPAFQPPPFDAAAWDNDPAKYLAEAVPGRVWQTAQPSPDVPRLALEGEAHHRIAPGAYAKLQVRTLPGAPVSWLSYDGGRFAGSNLVCITTRADDEGLATAEFRDSPGTTGACRIIAGSPMSSGQVDFRVFIAGK